MSAVSRRQNGERSCERMRLAMLLTGAAPDGAFGGQRLTDLAAVGDLGIRSEGGIAIDAPGV